MIPLNIQKVAGTNAITADLVIGSGRTFGPSGTGIITATVVLYAAGVTETSGTGTPEGVVTASIGSVFHRTNGSTGTTLYIKESGTGNTGWVAIVAGSGDMLLGTTQTVTAAKTFNTGTLKIGSSGDLVDSSGNELFKFTATASAINEVTVANAAAGSGPVLSATGGDTNISINLAPKGSGSVVIFNASTDSNFTINSTSNGPFLRMQRGATTKALFGVSGSANNVITGSATDDFCIREDASANILFSTDAGSTISFQVVASNGGIKTSAPSGGTAAAWKLGSLVTAAVVADTTRYIQLDVGGTLYKVIIST